ncbi:MAG: UDP-glucose 4-epimerase [uncultured Thermomicrobiales bacterium]|uniref:UDP-glucose 4-epimerase n=1 Tax=uncultured Thermomicrobiales bacterium TaxID=1645740 RepID=A0A6J4VH43_9BACT|nr:MAG: UDP-glucose 4-epimerase [uncultured Thermomicrobiales bacterium]
MAQDVSSARAVLLTGAAGRIGGNFFEHAKERYRFRLAHRDAAKLAAAAGEEHEAISLDVADPDACRAACDGIDTVVHLAADPSPEADFYGSLLDNNIKGTYNVFRAAADAGCRRIVYASSVHAVFAYPLDVQAKTDSPVRPANMYGVSKCFGEALAACFANDGLSSIAVRIGAYEAPWVHENPTAEAMAMYVSHRDLNQLLTRCVDADDVPFAIVHGVSDNRFKRLDLTSTRELLGYAPEDDGFALFGAGLRD